MSFAPSLSSAEQTSSGANLDDGESNVFNIGGNPNISPLARSAESFVKSPYVGIVLAIGLAGFLIMRGKK